MTDTSDPSSAEAWAARARAAGYEGATTAPELEPQRDPFLEQAQRALLVIKVEAAIKGFAYGLCLGLVIAAIAHRGNP